MHDSALVAAYWKHFRLLTGNRKERLEADEWRWAAEAVDGAVHGSGSAEGTGPHEQPDDPVALLVALASAAPDTAGLAYLGAGPVEDLLVSGAFDLNRVDDAARQNEKFRTALRCAWFDARVPPDVAQRLRRFGPPL